MSSNGRGLDSEQKKRYYHNLDERAEEIALAIKDGEKPRLRRVALHLTSDCSLRCSYCKTRRVDDRLTVVVGLESWNGVEVNHREVEPFMFERVDESVELGLQQLHIFGGEPTLVDNLPYLIERATKSHVNTSVVTNGATPNTSSQEYREGLLVSGLGTLTVSLDTYCTEINDNTVKVGGAWQATVDFIKWVVGNKERLGRTGEDDMPVYINTVVTNDSLFSLPQHIKFLKELGVTDVKLLIVKKSPDRRISEKTYDLFVEKEAQHVIDLARSYGFRMFADDVETFFNGNPKIRENVIGGMYYLPFHIPCYLSLTELAIASDGEVYTCIYHFWDRKKGTGMNVLNQTMNEIFVKYDPLSNNDPSVCSTDCTRKVIDINREIYGMLNG
jgi:MoaA/NifB/PqqE/SkfB family radical SAM enzyme